MNARYFLSALVMGAGFGQVLAQAPKPQPESPLKPGPQLRTLHQDDYDFRGGGDGTDECANATVLVVGSSCVAIGGSTAGATQSQAAIACGGFTSQTALDVWFQFTATASSTTITATGVGDFDVVMQVFSGPCGNLVSLGCADATFPPGGLVETFVAATTPGQTYRVRIYSYQPPTNTSTAFTICAFSTGGGSAPANDNCASATVQNLSVPGSLTVTGNNTGATVDPPTNFTIVWHAFTTTACSNIALNYCVPGSVFDDFLVNLVANCADFAQGLLTGTVSGDNCTLSFANVPAGTYYVPVLVDATLTPVGAYSVGITTTACSGAGPANDDCANAITIGVNATCQSTQGTTQGATQSLPPATCSTFTASAANDVWYTFTATAASTTVQVDGDGDATAGMDPILEVFSGPCGNLISLGCVDATGRGGAESLVVATTPGTVYRYRVYYWTYGTPQTVFGFTTCVTAAGGGPAYCTAGADGTGLGLDERIINVAFSSINNSSPDAVPAAPAYSDFTNVVGNVTAGQSYPIAIDVARTGANNSFDENQAIVWIDFNQDLDFNDAGEQVFVSAIGSVDIYTGTIAIPAGASLGSTRMRIRLHDTHDGSVYTNNFNNTPCGLASYGEVEDYTVNISSGGGSTPPNDLCGSVTPVGLSVGGSISFSGDNTNATGTGDAVPGSALDPLDPTVWHAFTTTECATVTVSYCDTDPAFGNVWIFLSPGCPVGDDFVLGDFSLDACPDNIVVTYQNLPAGTWYLPVLMDPVAAMGPYSITVSATECGYCVPSSFTGPDDGDFVSNVELGAIINPTTFDLGVTYQDYLSQSTVLVQGLSYDITIASGEYEENMLAAWIDFDANESFDPSEKLGEVLTSVPFESATFVFTVPFNAVVGPTRLRVRSVYPGNGEPDPADPCFSYTYGETEDYTILIDFGTSAAEAQGASWGVFPNPNDGNMRITYSGVSGNAVIELMDATGRIVHAEQRAVTDGASVQLGLAGRLAHGAYTLRMQGPGGELRQERVIVH
jgi:hypothetical protein